MNSAERPIRQGGHRLHPRSPSVLPEPAGYVLNHHSCQSTWTELLTQGSAAGNLRLLQQAGWKLLTQYVNGGVGRHWYAYPFHVGCSTGLIDQAAELKMLWTQFAETYQHRLPSGHVESKDVAAVLCQHYQCVGQALDRLPSGVDHEYDVVVPQNVDACDTCGATVTALARHVARLQPFVSYWVHGSVGAGDQKPAWSDLDGLAVISSSTFTCPRTLATVRRGLIDARRYLVDYFPFQAHGHFVLASPDLSWFPEPFFPPQLFAHATCLVAASEALSLRVRTDRQLALEMLWQHGIADLLRGPEHHLKNTLTRILFLHRVYLLPCLVSQVAGQPLFKRDAFSALHELFREEEAAAIDRVADIWRRWRPPPRWMRTVSRCAAALRFNPLLYSETSHWIGSRLPWFQNVATSDWHEHVRDIQATARSVWQRFGDGIALAA